MQKMKKEEFKDNISSAINMAMKVDKRSARQIAISIGVDPGAFHLYKAGVQVPKVLNYNKVKELASVNGVDLDKIVGLK